MGSGKVAARKVSASTPVTKPSRFSWLKTAAASGGETEPASPLTAEASAQTQMAWRRMKSARAARRRGRRSRTRLPMRRVASAVKMVGAMRQEPELHEKPSTGACQLRRAPRSPVATTLACSASASADHSAR